ncbi:putative DNA-binding protein [Macrococcoides caseolyticum]|uniref:putative DNA-binding protein n=1 Tax=Macrococcoides caseolyticum TaxID=69966 RepID=UPI000C3260B1|nr:putative DNA-binding protein [Macrococcus caseolyticus]PKE34754.1 putative DNA-binding protein [Macrococcus caseolyticus]PKF30906.1 putative DNA-binding protein [Macrococcus caseolyticus]TDM18993.1 putative DNA-binding protein [Macrococcus caseolyticus]VUC68459.1 putative DNA-binding protein [Macrococcus caseolyticus]
MSDLLKTMRMNYLFDFYQSLLTDKQRNYLEKYYMDDESLSEIAETFEVSRQAVYDNIRRTGDLLEEYESKLGLYHKFEQRQAIYEEMLRLTKLQGNAQRNQQLEVYIEQLQRIE